VFILLKIMLASITTIRNKEIFYAIFAQFLILCHLFLKKLVILFGEILQA